jgi:hypothetical protein
MWILLFSNLQEMYYSLVFLLAVLWQPSAKIPCYEKLPEEQTDLCYHHETLICTSNLHVPSVCAPHLPLIYSNEQCLMPDPLMEYLYHGLACKTCSRDINLEGGKYFQGIW